MSTLTTMAAPSVGGSGPGAAGGGAPANAAGAGEGGLSPGDLSHLLGAFNEVTARLTQTHEALQARVEQLQRELREANEAVERSRHLAMLGEMAAGIAHEVRNPLGSIGLYARMLQEDLADQPAPRATAAKIGAAVQRLNAVVGDVLAFARPVQVQSAEHDARELLEGALHAARGGGPEWAGLRVVLSEAGGVRKPVLVRGDANLLHQALVNVIGNAVSVMHEHGCATRVLYLGSTRRRVRESGAGPARMMSVLTVRDTGPGIDPEVLPRIFQPFFTTRAAGTGLGLAIVHRIMDAHGGRVTIRNHEEGGAVVELMVPA